MRQCRCTRAVLLHSHLNLQQACFCKRNKWRAAAAGLLTPLLAGLRAPVHLSTQAGSSKASDNPRILACAQSNAAIDELLARLASQGIFSARDGTRRCAHVSADQLRWSCSALLQRGRDVSCSKA